jgi:hypothetical protein
VARDIEKISRGEMTMNIAETIKDMLMPEAEVQSLRDMFVEGLKDVYYAECRQVPPKP